MHVHELNPKRTAIALVLFALVIVVGLITMTNPRLKYALTPAETIKMVSLDEGFFYPYQLAGMLSGHADTVLLIDLRNAFEYGRGSIPRAENISAVELLNEENIERLEQLKNDGVSVVVFADSQLDANGPWMVLRQLGFENVKILLGGYDYYKKRKNDLASAKNDDSYLPGKADYNFAEMPSAPENSSANAARAKTSITVRRKKKAAVAEGGC